MCALQRGPRLRRTSGAVAGLGELQRQSREELVIAGGERQETLVRRDGRGPVLVPRAQPSQPLEGSDVLRAILEQTFEKLGRAILLVLIEEDVHEREGMAIALG